MGDNAGPDGIVQRAHRVNAHVRRELDVGMSTVYIETSIVSYLRQKPSTQVVTAARQILTHQWWNVERQNYDLVISQYVIDEVSGGDPTLAADRLESPDGIPLLPDAPEIPQIASETCLRAFCPQRRRSMRFISPP